jgi:hypothetical protein
MARVLAVLFYSIVISMMIFAVLNKHANAQSMSIVTALPCADSKGILKQLTEIYHEQSIGGGLTNSGDEVRLFKSDKDTFTVILSKPNGLSCIIASGGDWQIKGEGNAL